MFVHSCFSILFHVPATAYTLAPLLGYLRTPITAFMRKFTEFAHSDNHLQEKHYLWVLKDWYWTKIPFLETPSAVFEILVPIAITEMVRVVLSKILCPLH